MYVCLYNIYIYIYIYIYIILDQTVIKLKILVADMLILNYFDIKHGINIINMSFPVTPRAAWRR